MKLNIYLISISLQLLLGPRANTTKLSNLPCRQFDSPVANIGGWVNTKSNRNFKAETILFLENSVIWNHCQQSNLSKGLNLI